MNFWIAFILGFVLGGFLVMLRLRSKIRLYERFLETRLVPGNDPLSKKSPSVNSRQLPLLF